MVSLPKLACVLLHQSSRVLEVEFDDDSLSTYRVSRVNDKDTLTINSYSEFIWNNFLNTIDKEETVVFIRNIASP